MNKVTRKSKDVVIYVLYDPRDEKQTPRYVGKSEVALIRRLNTHIAESRQPARHHWHKSRWFRKLENEGVKPAIKPIETVALGDSWQEREIYWIKTYRDMGYPLTNLTDGGEGTLNRVYSEETRKKISKALTGRPSPKKGKKMRLEAYQNVLEANYKELPKSIMDMLGKEHDAELARQAGVSTVLIKNRRLENGIPKYEDLSTPNGFNPNSWPQWALDKLGKVEDTTLAKELGITKNVVGQLRRLLDIKSLRDSSWTQDKIDLLGTKPDYVVAALIGVTTMAVNYKRRSLGIHSYSKQLKLKDAC
ncbi:MAG: GIY-YIG nuclease family protein [Nodosilinea sp. WJT8-NPBG4]|jgi:hypothetical protein|nr:GIY-YIG nuclease family protein [Nodosilinea sp. WJT8-NPBG4]